MRHIGAAPLRDALEHYNRSIWEIVSEPPGVLHREALRPRLRLLPGRYALLAALVHGSVGAWLDSSCHEHAHTWFRTGRDPVQVVESIGRVERRLGETGLPLPLHVLACAVRMDPDLAALCVALSERFVLHRGYVCRRRAPSPRGAVPTVPTMRIRRAIGLHGVLSCHREVGPMTARALIEEYGEIRPRDSFGHGELRHVLETNPQLFLRMGRYGWYPLHGAADPGPPSTGEDDGPDRAPPDGRVTIRSMLVDILAETGVLRFIELREIFRRRSKGVFRTRDGISSVLRTNGEFTRVAPGCYDLTERADLYDPVTECSDALMSENACATYTVCRHAGEPVGSFALWTPGQERAWCRWARRNASARVFESLLAVVSPELWDVGPSEKRTWTRLCRRRARYRLQSQFRCDLAARLPAAGVLAVAAAFGRHVDALSWVRINMLTGRRVTDDSASRVLALLVALGAVRAARHWQRPHRTDRGRCGAILESLEPAFFSAARPGWDAACFADLLARAREGVARVETGWVGRDELVRLLAAPRAD
ncbi:MAG: hypothetical protein JRG91_12555 [Deltaproteobacteria bacterium]|nr:hypothetical protein [Deltaproteobacteria bacterium]